MDTRRIGLLGAGQLGRMFVEAASRLNVEVHLLEVGQDAPAKQISSSSHHVDGAFNDSVKIRQLAKDADILTIEIEHVNSDALQAILEEGLVKEVHPTPKTIKLIQDKYNQKKFLEDGGIPVADFVAVGPEGHLGESSIARMSQEEGIHDAAEQFGYPLMIKSRTQAYDGRGNFVVKDESDAKKAVAALGGGTRGLYAERWTSFEKEVAVMVVRSSSGEVRGYPTVETYHENSICHSVFAPLRHSDMHVASNAQEIAMQAVSMLEGAGVFGVEMFLLKDGELLVNEIAPRPHNSGHYTIEACETSQYENHVRAILGFPLGSTDMKVASAAMINILGLADLEDDEGALEKTYASAVASLSVPGASVHLYGKKGCRKGRKMGHITIVGRNDAQVRDRFQTVIKALETAKQAAVRHARLPQILTIKGAIDLHKSSSSSSASTSTSSAEADAKKKTAADFSHPHPLVGVIMGSDSDLPVMLPAAHLLKEFNVPFELTIVSAHRTPDRMMEYARSAASRGLRVIIAGAGGAAHLPGMVAAQTPLPVVGVPVKGSTLDGVDSLHSIVQMPRGIPVATVAINNSTNAALLAARIIASAETDLMETMQKYMDEMEVQVLGKVERLKIEGWDYSFKK